MQQRLRTKNIFSRLVLDRSILNDRMIGVMVDNTNLIIGDDYEEVFFYG